MICVGYKRGAHGQMRVSLHVYHSSSDEKNSRLREKVTGN